MSHAFATTPRLRLTPQQRAKLFLEADGKCAVCTRRIVSEIWHVDHATALELGGTNDWSNLRVICKNCHTPKTRDDHGKASHARDKAVAHVVPGVYRSKSSLRRPPGTRYDWGKRRYVREE